jgi:site-specific recombinase XerC
LNYSIRDYESVLARRWRSRSPTRIRSRSPSTTLREVIDVWGERSARTRQKVTSVIRAFWSWAEDQGFVPFSPAAKIRRPRAQRKAAPLLPANVDARLLASATTARDRLALLVLLDCGVRRAELGGIRARDFDLGRRQLTVMGKGQKARILPCAAASCSPRRNTSWKSSRASGARRSPTIG